MSIATSEKPLLSRSQALARRNLRVACLCMLLGLLVPFVALWGAIMGWQLRPVMPRAGWSLIAVGVAIFVVRMAIYLG